MTTESVDLLSFADAELVSFQFVPNERLLRVTFHDVYDSSTATFVDGALVVSNWDQYLFDRYRYPQDSWQRFVDDQGDELSRVALHAVLPTGIRIEGFAKETEDWCTYEFSNAEVAWLPSGVSHSAVNENGQMLTLRVKFSGEVTSGSALGTVQVSNRNDLILDTGVSMPWIDLALLLGLLERLLSGAEKKVAFNAAASSKEFLLEKNGANLSISNQPCLFTQFVDVVIGSAEQLCQGWPSVPETDAARADLLAATRELGARFT